MDIRVEVVESDHLKNRLIELANNYATLIALAPLEYGAKFTNDAGFPIYEVTKYNLIYRMD